MFLLPNHLRCTVAVAIVLTTTEGASAGWMGFRNDTSNTLVIQEAITEGRTPRFGRLQKLLAMKTPAGGAAAMVPPPKKEPITREPPKPPVPPKLPAVPPKKKER
jgi:hypothetical protein